MEIETVTCGQISPNVTWISHPRFELSISTKNFVRQPVEANNLFDLPKNYCEMFNKTAKFK
uniref:Uncharacterized protein n=1 Tax=Romanomermis culicivorax TaxID=13658 RepID=A0A915I658_ROMCU